MKTSTVFRIVSLIWALGLLAAASPAQEPTYAPGRLIVKFREGVSFTVPAKSDNPVKFNIPEVDELNAARSCTGTRQLMQGKHDPKPHRAFLLYFSGTPDIPALAEEYLETGLFQYAEPDYDVRSIGDLSTLTTPDDLYFYHQWSLYNDGTFPYFPAKTGADIDMLEAWQTEQGDSNIVATIIDSGCKTDNPDLAPRLWTNPGEIPDNGIDDDANGYVDDVHGWNYIASSNEVMDDFFHGTAVTGIIGAVANNGFGYAGVDWNCKLQTVKVLNSSGGGSMSDVIDGIYYATDNGGDVINMSLVGPDSQAFQDAVAYAYANNVTIVAACGNSNSNTPLYPAAYPTVIAVGATSANDERPRLFLCGGAGSSYGMHLSVMAPGDGVPIIWYLNDYEFGLVGCGTSFAAPHVVGVCTLLLAQDPTRTPDSLKAILKRTADDLVGDPVEDIPGFDQFYGAGRLNAYKALNDKKDVMSTGTRTTNSLAIYPNPATDRAWVKIPGISGALQGSITITDAAGAVRQNSVISGSPAQVDLTPLSTGLYIITIRNGTSSWRGKIVKIE